MNQLIREINSRTFVDMLISGANNLINNKQKVDDMNVFPVPDGDTGTNMSMTMKACVAGIKSAADLTVSDVATSLANDTLRGARGNSGVILSQLMRGFKKAFSGANTSDVALFAKAFKTATDCAYRAVMKPTEGTILTVAREMSECAVKYSQEVEDFESFFALVTDAGTPAISDPGEDLVRLCIDNEIDVVPIPGAVAGINALIISGLSTRRFSFEGFLPVGKSERDSILSQLCENDHTLIFY